MDSQRLEDFSELYMSITRGAALMAVLAVADRTGLLTAMQGQGPLVLEEVVSVSKLQKRLVTEVLAALGAAGFVEYSPEGETYLLSDEAAACIADESSVHFLGGWSQIVPSLHGVIPEVARACVEGGGVPYSSYGREIVRGMGRSSAPELRGSLLQRWLPAVPGLVERLNEGIVVADVGCGAGDASLVMASAFPNSTFLGIETSATSVAMATDAARLAQLSNVSFLKIEQEGIPADLRFDFMLAIDVIHDVAHPGDVLRRIREVLAPGGKFLMLEPDARDNLEDNLNPSGALLYAMSTMHCVPISLAEDGEGVGAAWGPARIEACCEEAGFTSVRTLPLGDGYNAFYLLS